MKRALILAACVAASVALSGCANLQGLTQAGGVGDKILTNLEGCRREYSGAIGAGVTGSFRILCEPAAAPAVQAAPVAEPVSPPGGT